MGDDVLHAPLPFHSVPDFIASKAPSVAADTPVDLVFINFIKTQILGILNTLQKVKTYTAADVQEYSPILSNQALGLYAQAVWK